MILTEVKEILKQFLQGEEEYLWLKDSRILWEGLEDQFYADFETNGADFLATQVRRYAEDPGWTWWAHVHALNASDLSSWGVAALLPLVRFSRKAAEAVVAGTREDWPGHPEAVIPTLVNRAGLVIEDIGGTGSFTPAERRRLWYDERTWHWRGPVEYVQGKIHFPLLSRHHAAPPDEPAPEPCIAFLFLTRGDVNHRSIWEQYFAQAGARAHVLAHTKHPEQLADDSFLRNVQITRRVATAWGEISLVHATLALLRAALENSEITHFVLVSEGCVPVRPFVHLSQNLTRDPRSRLRIWTLDEVRRGGNRDKAMRLEQMIRISKDLGFFQEQWMCLSREDALIVTEKDWTPCFDRVYAADECYFATVLAASGKPLPEAIVNRSMTWTRWVGGAHPVEFQKVTPRLAAELGESGCYFARKFSVGSDVGRWALHRMESAVLPHVDAAELSWEM